MDGRAYRARRASARLRQPRLRPHLEQHVEQPRLPWFSLCRSQQQQVATVSVALAPLKRLPICGTWVAKRDSARATGPSCAMRDIMRSKGSWPGAHRSASQRQLEARAKFVRVGEAMGWGGVGWWPTRLAGPERKRSPWSTRKASTTTIGPRGATKSDGRNRDEPSPLVAFLLASYIAHVRSQIR